MIGRAPSEAPLRDRDTEAEADRRAVALRLADMLDRRRPGWSADPDFLSLWEGLGEASRGGKVGRPRLLLSTHRGLGGAREDQALQAAAAVELLHLALLAHDDVIDRDLSRRGRPNAVARFRDVARERGEAPEPALQWGLASSILAGDVLLSVAQGEMARLDLPQALRRRVLDAYEHALFRSAAGEHADVRLSLPAAGRPDPQQVRTMMGDKTSAYSFVLPLRLGALLAGASPAQEEALERIGEGLGLVYQLRDDLLGVFGTAQETGKSVVSDLREGKQTLLVLAAQGHPAWEAVVSSFGDPELDEDGAAALRRALENSGARAEAERLLREAVGEVGALLESSDLPRAVLRELRRTLDEGSERIA